MKGVNRTISFLESTVECRVIGVVFLPLEFLNEGKSVYPQQVLINEKEVSAYRKMIENDLNLPAYCIGIEQDMDSLLIRIIDRFTDEGESVDP